MLFGDLSAQTDSIFTEPVFQEWAILVVDGKRAGYENTVTTSDVDGQRYRTVHVEVLVIKRMAATLKLTDTSTITEDAQGVVLDFSSVTEGTGSRVESHGVREGDTMIVSSRGQSVRNPLPALSALGPEKVRRLTQTVPLQPGQSYGFRTFSSDDPKGVVLTGGTIEKKELHNVMGTDRLLWKLVGPTSLLPGVNVTSWVNDQGRDIDVLMNLPGIGTVHEIASDPATCLMPPEGAEIMAATLIHPQIAMPHPHALTQAIYRLTLSDTSRPLRLWDGDEQKVLKTGPGWCEVAITMPHFTADDAVWKLPYRVPGSPLLANLQATSYLETGSPLVQKLARQAVDGETNPVVAAHRIETFVRRYIIKKDLNIGFASAEETARSREGDCTEHAVLCAALGRAVGLPTRCVVGFGYIPPDVHEPTLANGIDRNTGIFAFHMWAEAWVGTNLWVPMDAALNGFDVGHIAITKTALDEVNPLIDLNAPIVRLLKDLKIEIVQTQSN